MWLRNAAGGLGVLAAAAAERWSPPVWICKASVKRTKSSSASRIRPIVSTLMKALRNRLSPGSEPKNRSIHSLRRP